MNNIINEKFINELLDYIERSINKLAKDTFDNLEDGANINKTISFLENQFDVRLENMLNAKNSSIHHLESGLKNKIIQKKQNVLNQFTKYKIK